MAYTPKHYYRAKDDLNRGDPNKRVRGSELSDEFEAISSDLRKVRDELSAEDGAINEINVEIDNINQNITNIEGDIAGIKVDVESNKTDINELRDDFENHDHTLDDLSDVNASSPNRDDLISWNGSVWEAGSFDFIESELTFQGGIDLTQAAPANPANGDLYVSDNEGVVDSSWTGIAGQNVVEGKFVGWAETRSRWYFLGDMADIGVTSVGGGVGISVDDSKPSEPVVSIDRDEVDKWYASPDDILWEQNGNDIYYNDGRVGIGTDNPKDQLTIASSLSASSDLQLSNTSTGGIKLINPTSAGWIETYKGGGEPFAGGLQFSVQSFVSGEYVRKHAMRIDSSGRVGIGTDNPDQTLHVQKGSAGNVASHAASVLTLENSTTGILQFLTPNNNAQQIRFGDPESNGVGIIQYDHAKDVMQFNVNSPVPRIFIDSSGRVGIGGEPGTRTIDEAKALAKTKLTEWKAEVKKRTAEQPEASTQEITLEVTDGDFGVMPTEQVLAEKLMSRDIGGGDDKLQVDGAGYFSGTVNAGGSMVLNDGNLYRNESNAPGLHFSTTSAIWPTDNAGSTVNGHQKISLGDSSRQFKDAYFSGTIYGKVDDVADHIKAITPTQIANWDAGTGGGGGATTDGRISDDQIIHWDQAYGWGNHANAGYQPAGNYLTSIDAGNGTKVTGNKVEMSGSYTGSFSATGTVNANSLDVNSTTFTSGPAVHLTNDMTTPGHDGYIGRHYVIDYLAGFSTRLEFQDQQATLRTAGHLLSSTLRVGVQACANINSASLVASPKGNVKSVTKTSTGRTLSKYVQDANLYVGALPVISAGIADISAKGTVTADYESLDSPTRFTQFGIARYVNGSPVEGSAFVVVGMPVDSSMKSRITSIEEEKRNAEYVNELFRKGEEAEYYDCDESGLAGSDKAWAAQTKSGGVEITRYIAVQEDKESYNKDLVMVRYADLPQEQWLFDAWKLDGKNVIVDLDKARSDVFATLKEQARFYLPRVSCLADIFDDDDEMKELKDLILGFKSKIRDKSVSVSELNAIMGRIRQEEQSDFAFKGF